MNKNKKLGFLIFGLGYLIFVLIAYVFYLIKTWNYSTFVCVSSNELANLVYFFSLIISLLVGLFFGSILGNLEGKLFKKRGIK